MLRTSQKLRNLHWFSSLSAIVANCGLAPSSVDLQTLIVLSSPPLTIAFSKGCVSTPNTTPWWPSSFCSTFLELTSQRTMLLSSLPDAMNAYGYGGDP